MIISIVTVVVLIFGAIKVVFLAVDGGDFAGIDLVVVVVLVLLTDDVGQIWVTTGVIGREVRLIYDEIVLRIVRPVRVLRVRVEIIAVKVLALGEKQQKEVLIDGYAKKIDVEMKIIFFNLTFQTYATVICMKNLKSVINLKKKSFKLIYLIMRKKTSLHTTAIPVQSTERSI